MIENEEEKKKITDAVYEAGRYAGKNGYNILDNPYAIEDYRHSFWTKGWMDGRQSG